MYVCVCVCVCVCACVCVCVRVLTQLTQFKLSHGHLLVHCILNHSFHPICVHVCILYYGMLNARQFIPTLPPTVPPGGPENLDFPSIGPYSVTVTWDPPSNDGGSPDPFNYMVALTTTSDGQSVSANQTAQTQLTFTALSHSENYTVSVVAVNSLGQQGPSAVGTFRTRDIREWGHAQLDGVVQ